MGFYGILSPITAGETYQETLAVTSAEDGSGLLKTFLDACTIAVTLRDSFGCQVMTGTATCPEDGFLIVTLPDTLRLTPQSYRLRVRLTKDGETQDILDATLPVLA